MGTGEQKQERVDCYARRQEQQGLESTTHQGDMVKETEEKGVVTYKRRGKGVCNDIMQEESEIEGPTLQRSVGKRSVVHSYIIDRPFKRHDKEQEVSEKTQSDKLVMRSSHRNGEGSQHIFKIYNRTEEETSNNEEEGNTSNKDKSASKDDKNVYENKNE